MDRFTALPRSVTGCWRGNVPSHWGRDQRNITPRITAHSLTSTLCGFNGHEDSTLNECDMGWCNQNYPPHSYDQNRLPESSSISSSSSPPMMMAAICRCPGGHSSAFTNNYLNTEHRSVVSSPYCPYTYTHQTGETLYCPLTKCLLTGNQ